MTRPLLAAVLFYIAPAAAGASDNDAASLQAAISELQGLIKGQRSRIEALKAANKPQVRKRRLDGHHEPDIYAPEEGKETRPYTQVEEFQGAMDHMWLIVCGSLVMFMQAGFAMVEAGTCRFKNVQNIMLKNLIDVCSGTLGWYALGWAFAYGGPYDDDGYKVNLFASSEQFFGHGFVTGRDDGQMTPSSDPVNWFFQWAFCSAAATIVSGGVAERVKFGGYLIFSFLMTSIIYPMVVAWTWGYGFLAKMNDVGSFDFAGSGIVHMTGGVGALVGAIIAGPRYGRWTGNNNEEMTRRERIFDVPEAFNPHSMVLVVLGTFSLWWGWYGFNCGSTLGLHDYETGAKAAWVAMNTTLAAATGGLVVFLIRFLMTRKLDVAGFCNGILAGLVSITAGCSNLEGGSSVLVAFCGALIYQMSSTLLRIVKIDDPLDAFAVHGACGMWGVTAAAYFDFGHAFHQVHAWSGFQCMKDDDGVCTTGLWGQMYGAAWAEIGLIIVWVGILCAVIFGILKAVRLLEADEDTQKEGFDLLKHSPRKAYDWGETDIPRTSI